MKNATISKLEDVLRDDEFQQSKIFAQKTLKVSPSEQVYWSDEELLKKMKVSKALVSNIAYALSPFPLGRKDYQAYQTEDFYNYLKAALGFEIHDLYDMNSDTIHRLKKLFVEQVTSVVCESTEWFISNSVLDEDNTLLIAEKEYYEDNKMKYALLDIHEIHLFDKADLKRINEMFINTMVDATNSMINGNFWNKAKTHVTNFLVKLLTIVPFTGVPLDLVEEEMMRKIKKGVMEAYTELFAAFKRDPLLEGLKIGYLHPTYRTHFKEALPVLSEEALTLMADSMLAYVSEYMEWVKNRTRYEKEEDEIEAALDIMDVLPEVLEALKKQ